MGRNIRTGDEGKIRFTLYGHTIENGKLKMSEIAKDRFYATQVEPMNITKTAVQSVIRSNGVSMTVVTTSIMNNINEDDYCRNDYTGELFRIDSIKAKYITNGTTRPLIERTLSLVI